jgi:hypothetical protein
LCPGNAEQNTIKVTTCSDGQGRTLWNGAVRPGRMHNRTAAKSEGIADLLSQHPTVTVCVDEGYRGLATAFLNRVTTPPRKPPKNAPAEQVACYQQARTEQSSRRICVEHAIAWGLGRCCRREPACPATPISAWWGERR